MGGACVLRCTCAGLRTLLRVSAPFPPHGSNLGGLARLGDKSLLQAGSDLKRFRSSKLRRTGGRGEGGMQPEEVTRQ